MKISTTRFGIIEVDESSIINLIQGPLGFEPQNRYCLFRHSPDARFLWLQSIQEPSLAFVVIDPSEFFADYEFEISDADAEKIHLTNAEDAIVLAIVTISKKDTKITVNIAAPIVINSKELTGMQIVLQDSPYSIKQPLAPCTAKKLQKREDALSRSSVVSKAA